MKNMPKNAAAEKVDNFFRQSLSIGLYITTYPFLKWYFNKQSREYAKQLVEITETPKEVLNEPIIIEPSVKYPSMVTRSQHERELFEKRGKRKRRVYIDISSINDDDILEEISHEIRDRIHDDKDKEVTEFFGMVGRILIKDPKIKHRIPTVDDILKWQLKRDIAYENLCRKMQADKEEIIKADKETFIRKSEEAKMPKETINILRRLPDEYYKSDKLREAWSRLLLDTKYLVLKSFLEDELVHAGGYEAAVRNREDIEKNPKGIYLLSEEEVRQRFF